jgi:hypothetical protein
MFSFSLPSRPLYPPDNVRTNPRLVSLRTEDEDNTSPQHQAPLPGYRRLIEHILRDRTDVNNGDERDDACND